MPSFGEFCFTRAIILAAMLSGFPILAPAAVPPEAPMFEQYLQGIALSQQTIDQFFLQGELQFDPELGFIEKSRHPSADGIDGSLTISTIQPDGARTAFMYIDKKPRINTYGDSCTHGDQVNDGETWQEYLAGHFAEPIGNFGTGGHGVYQAYRRMIREEKTDHAAKYLVLHICGDDSTRSLFRSIAWVGHAEGELPARGVFPFFPGTFKANVEMDLKTGQFVEKENLVPTRDSAIHMTDPQWIVAHLKDDLALQLALYELGVIRDLDHDKISKLAAELDFPFDWKQESTLQDQAEALLDRYSQRASVFVLGKAREFARQNGKKLLVVLNSPDRALPDLIHNKPRFDQEIIDYLVKEKFDYFDMNEIHLQDYRKSHLTFDEYMSRYFIVSPVDSRAYGHYSPRGNHFFAYSIKDKMVEWLDPKPLTYLVSGKSISYEHQTNDTDVFKPTIKVYSRKNH
jgi:hypothetical protein